MRLRLRKRRRAARRRHNVVALAAVPRPPHLRASWPPLPPRVSIRVTSAHGARRCVRQPALVVRQRVLLLLVLLLLLRRWQRLIRLLPRD
jgi:hypothetical protein